MLKIAMSDGGGANDKRAIGDSLGDGGEFLGSGKNIGRGPHGRACTFKSYIIGIHDSQMEETEIAHGAGGCADIEGVTSVDQDDAQAIEFNRSRQALILRQQ
jgi:hypothetical protein